jgi:hypothetical protein
VRKAHWEQRLKDSAIVTTFCLAKVGFGRFVMSGCLLLGFAVILASCDPTERCFLSMDLGASGLSTTVHAYRITLQASREFRYTTPKCRPVPRVLLQHRHQCQWITMGYDGPTAERCLINMLISSREIQIATHQPSCRLSLQTTALIAVMPRCSCPRFTKTRNDIS